MSRLNDSEKREVPQGVNWNEEDWQEVLGRLPKEWREQAIKQKAWQRGRKLLRVEDLLRALLAYAACGWSLRQLGIWATLIGLGSLCERGWRKRLQKSADWICWLMGAVLGTGQRPDWLPTHPGRVLLVDATRWGEKGGTGDDVRMHCGYDLQAGRLVQVKVTDRFSKEGLEHLVLAQGDIVVTDAGYLLGKSIQEGQACGVFGVHRFSAHQVRLEREDGQKIALKRLIKHQRYATVSEYRVWVWEPTHQKRFAIRLIISLPERKQVQQTRRRKREQIRRKKGSKASLAPAWWAGVMLVGTTLPAKKWTAVEVVKLYRARWQIELFFKRLKQGLRLHLLPLQVWERAQTYVHLCVLLWGLQEQEEQALMQELSALLTTPVAGTWQGPLEEEDKQVQWVISQWAVAQCSLQTWRFLLQGSWSLHRLHDALPQLRRYLVARDRPQRRSQRKQILQWLLQQFALPLSAERLA